jgi:hypothetical protein
MGIIKVYMPNVKLLNPCFLKVAMFISTPARNMMYSNHTVPNNIMLLSRSIRFRPLGPMIAPAMINPINGGILNLFRINGANKIMNSMSENNNTGFLSGKEKFSMSRIIIGTLVRFCLSFKNKNSSNKFLLFLICYIT